MSTCPRCNRDDSVAYLRRLDANSDVPLCCGVCGAAWHNEAEWQSLREEKKMSDAPERIWARKGTCSEIHAFGVNPSTEIHDDGKPWTEYIRADIAHQPPICCDCGKTTYEVGKDKEGKQAVMCNDCWYSHGQEKQQPTPQPTCSECGFTLKKVYGTHCDANRWYYECSNKEAHTPEPQDMGYTEDEWYCPKCDVLVHPRNVPFNEVCTACGTTLTDPPTPEPQRVCYHCRQHVTELNPCEVCGKSNEPHDEFDAERIVSMCQMDAQAEVDAQDWSAVNDKRQEELKCYALDDAMREELEQAIHDLCALGQQYKERAEKAVKRAEVAEQNEADAARYLVGWGIKEDQWKERKRELERECDKQARKRKNAYAAVVLAKERITELERERDELQTKLNNLLGRYAELERGKGEPNVGN